jgi:hypothetical protein
LFVLVETGPEPRQKACVGAVLMKWRCAGTVRLTERLRIDPPARRLGSFLGLLRSRHYAGSSTAFRTPIIMLSQQFRHPTTSCSESVGLTGAPGHIYRFRRRTAESRLYYNEYSERTSVLGAVRHRRTEVDVCHLARTSPILLFGLIVSPRPTCGDMN